MLGNVGGATVTGGQEAMAADHNEAGSVNKIDSSAETEANVGCEWWVEGCDVMFEVEAPDVTEDVSVLDFLLLGDCFRGLLIKVLTSWPVSGSNLRRFLAPFRRPLLDFLPQSAKMIEKLFLYQGKWEILTLLKICNFPNWIKDLRRSETTLMQKLFNAHTL